MHPDAKSDPQPALFDIAYQDGAGTRNPDFSGDGTLAIHSDEPVYRFTGNSGGLRPAPRTLNFRSDEVWNVAFGGNKVQFESTMGKSAAKRIPFVFFCNPPCQASQIAKLFPQTRDQDFVTRLNFGQQLQQLPAASSRWTSVTNQIIGLNILVFIVMGLLGAGWVTTESMSPYVLYVANNAGATTDGEWWRVFTSMFVHFGLLHLALNMWALYQTGHFVEKILGRPLFAIAYLGSGLIASFTSLVWHGDQVWSAGASGAVFGVFGMIIGFMLREKRSIPSAIVKPMMRSALTFAGYNLVFGMIVPQIDNSAHLGGLAGGFVLGWLVAMPLEPGLRVRLWRRRLLTGVGAVVVLCSVGVAIAPRYDYRFREEILWDKDSHAAQKNEEAMLLREHEQISAYQFKPNAAALIAWLTQDSIPFYENWLARINAMPLSPEKITARRREALTELIQIKIDLHRQLADDLRTRPDGALIRYLKDSKQLPQSLAAEETDTD